jgi:adenine nucleotide transporter 17
MAAAFAEAPPVAHALGGSLGSALALLLFYPLERARIELQSQASSSSNNSNSNSNDETRSEELKSDTADVSPTKEPKVVVLGDEEETEDVGEEDVAQSPSLETSSDDSWEPLEQQRKPQAEETTPSRSITTSEDSSSGSPASRLVNKNNNKNFGLLNCLLKLHKRGALYQGVTPVISTIFTSQFIFFFMNAYVKRLLKSFRPHLNENRSSSHPTKSTVSSSLLASDPIVNLLSSCLAGIGNVLLTNPLWVVNMAIITGEAKTSSLWQEFWTMVRQRGLLHMWNGTSASLLLVSNPVIQFFCYEQFKQHTIRHRAQKSLAPMEAFSVGAVAKAIATVSTYPLQLAQTVLRLKDNGYRGTLDCLIRLFQRGGMKEWYTGMRAKLLQTVLTAAFTFLTYEQILGAVQAALIRATRGPNPRAMLL